MSNLKETSESESKHNPIDPSVDITSEHFDPLKALYAENVTIPYTNAKVYDNVSKFESCVINKKTTKNEATTSKETHSTNPTSISSNTQTKTDKLKRFPASDEPFVRRFLPHQLMVKGHRKEKHSRNLLKKIEKGFGGPLDMLRVYMMERKRVKIYTRKEHGILGYITGFIESFDKHWNIALSDVYEVWKRKKVNFCDAANYGPPENCSQKLRRMKIQFPKVAVKSLNRKYVECSRRVPQLMIRGEQVAVVMLDLSTS